MGRILIGGTASLLICIFLSPKFIEFLRKREFGQQIREDGPEGHHVKAGTPTMGGGIIFLAVSVPFLILSDYEWRSIGVFGVAIACALLGFTDDYIKLVRRRSLGLRARTKLVVTIAISLALWYVAEHKAHLPPTLRLRFVDYQIDLGLLYPLLIYFVVAGTTSAVNLTDGLAGLAAGGGGGAVLAPTRDHLHHRRLGHGDARGLPGGGVRRLFVVQRVPCDGLHGRHRLAWPGGRDRGIGGDDEDRGAVDPARRNLRDRGAVGRDPGDLVSDDAQTCLPDGADPPPFRAGGGRERG